VRHRRSAPWRRLIAILVVAAAVAADPQVAAAASAPVARWAFEEGTGSVAADSVGDLDGTLEAGADWLTTGAVEGDGALDLAADGAVRVSNAPALEPGELTISAWVRSDTPPDVGDVIFEKGAFGCDGPSYGLYVSEFGLEMRYRAWSTSSTISRSVHDAHAWVDLWDGAWHLIALAIYTGTSDHRISIDGVTLQAGGVWQAGQPQAIVYAGATDSAFTIGGPVDASCGGGSFTGAIDDVRLHSTPTAIDGMIEQMPPIPVSIDLLTEGTLAGSSAILKAKVTPTPRFGAVVFDILDADTQAVLRTESGNVGVANQGVASATMIMPAKGTYLLRATFDTRPYTKALDTTTVETIGVASKTTSWSYPTSAVPGDPVILKASVVSDGTHFSQQPSGSVRFYRVVGRSQQEVATAPLTPAGTNSSTASHILADGLSEGTHAYIARYLGDQGRIGSRSAIVTIVVARVATFVLAEGPGVVEAHHPFLLNASLGSPRRDWATASTMTFTRVGSSTPACVVGVATSNSTSCTAPALPVGTHTYRVTYSGNATNAPSTSDDVTVKVTPDLVHAIDVKRNYSVFYPVKDDYRDSLTLSGNRQEPISVAIKIYSPSGTLVRSASIARASGTYKYAWNGRNSSGSVLAAGRYKIYQTLTDAAGTKATFTSLSDLSRKRIVEKTVYVTKDGDAVSAKADPGGGSIVISSSGGYAKLTAKYPDGRVAVGYQFTIPAADVYKSVAFQIYVKAPMSVPPNDMGMQNFTTCPYSSAWDEGCFDRWAGVGSGSTVWKSTSGSPTHNRHERTIRGFVVANAFSLTIYEARVKVVYGVLQ